MSNLAWHQSEAFNVPVRPSRTAALRRCWKAAIACFFASCASRPFATSSSPSRVSDNAIIAEWILPAGVDISENGALKGVLARVLDDVVLIAPKNGRPLYIATRARRREQGAPISAGDTVAASFQRIASMSVCDSGSVSVFDASTRTFSIVSRSGAKIVSAAASVGSPRDVDAAAAACSKQWQVFAQARRIQGDAIWGSLIVMDSQGRTRDSISEVRLREIVRLRGGAGPKPLGAELLFTISGADVIYAWSADPKLYRYSLLQRATHAVSLPIRPRTLTRNEIATAVREVALGIPSSLQSEFLLAYESAAPPAQAPAMYEMRVDAVGLVWLSTGVGDDGLTHFRAFAPGGEECIDISLPERSSLLDIAEKFRLTRIASRATASSVIQLSARHDDFRGACRLLTRPQ